MYDKSSTYRARLTSFTREEIEALNFIKEKEESSAMVLRYLVTFYLQHKQKK